jgi:exonuclease SbcC
MSWKISKIKIEKFKAFDETTFNFDTASLVTLDGPNGYGKTSIFDAIELLLTGRVGRICQLFSNIMLATVTNYEDNLYWNKALNESNLCIRAEFTNDTNEFLCLARMATVADLKNISKNRADNFDCFQLYRMESFDSNLFSTKMENSEVNPIFGDNFIENYSFLNYVEQGQSRFLFSQKTDKRRDELSKLMNSQWLVTAIDKYKKLERAIQNKHLSADCVAQEKTLLEKIASLNKQIGADSSGELYFKLISSKFDISWDKEIPFSVADIDIYNLYINEISILKEIVINKDEVKRRLKNKAIDKYLEDKKSLLKKTVEIGHHIESFAALQSIKINLDALEKISSSLKKGAKLITRDDVTIVASKYAIDDSINLTIDNRDKIIANSGTKTIAVTELDRIKNEIISSYKKIHTLDSSCPLCGHEWQVQEKLLQAIQVKRDADAKELGDIFAQLQQTLTVIDGFTNPIIEAVSQDLIKLKSEFNPDLYNCLHENHEFFEAIRAVKKRLQEQNIEFSSEFTVDGDEVLRRQNQLTDKIRALKEQEISDLPSNWFDLLGKLFDSNDDLYLLDIAQIEKKYMYVNFKFNSLKVSTLNELQKQLRRLQNERIAANNLKNKIKETRDKLENLLKSYQSHTILDIELMFHIYSGRLIQNYQRGLGLFIEEGNGSHLKFTTAERSQHDALLSMSTGQISALSLAFFFSLNRVYCKSPLILIDDPTQSLDEINIASLTDLLRCEFKDRQIVISSHEDDISSYIRYRFTRAGMRPTRIHMQQHQQSTNRVEMQ